MNSQERIKLIETIRNNVKKTMNSQAFKVFDFMTFDPLLSDYANESQQNEFIENAKKRKWI